MIPGDMAAHEAAEGLVVRHAAKDLLRGSLAVDDLAGGWSRPWRFLPVQMRALTSCMAWHPGLFSQMARSTAGVTVAFETDASEVALEVRVDEEPRGTMAQLAFVDAWREGQGFQASEGMRLTRDASMAHDGLSCDVDGTHLPCTMPGEGDRLVRFKLPVSEEAPRPVCPGRASALPGLAMGRSVRIWLPALRGCEVHDVVCDGSFIRPLAMSDGMTGSLLVLGDSIAQGFVTGDPASSWPALVATSIGRDLVNQGVGGQVFQETSLAGLSTLADPACIIVALGANYRFERCGETLVSQDVSAYLGHVSRAWPDVPVLVLTPTWHDEHGWPSNAQSCWKKVPDLIARAVSTHPNMHLVDGRRLLDESPLLLADGLDHPNAKGAADIAGRVLEVLGRSPAWRAFEPEPQAEEASTHPARSKTGRSRSGTGRGRGEAGEQLRLV